MLYETSNVKVSSTLGMCMKNSEQFDVKYFQKLMITGAQRSKNGIENSSENVKIGYDR